MSKRVRIDFSQVLLVKVYGYGANKITEEVFLPKRFSGQIDLEIYFRSKFKTGFLRLDVHYPSIKINEVIKTIVL